MVLLGQNVKFDEFRDRLAAKGYTLRPLWEAGSNRTSTAKPRTDVRCFAVVGSGTAPKIGTLIAVDYDRDGFGLYFEAQTVTFDDDIAAIIGGDEAQEAR